MEFSCTAQQSGERVVVTVTGDVDLAAHTLFQERVERWLSPATDLVVDCSQVSFMDSMGLRVLVYLRQQVLRYGRTITLQDPSTPVLRVLELAGVKGLFTQTSAAAEYQRERDPDPDLAV
jgi:stage II sporulation protein AA (anti-sigma F factor antagonist)